LGGGNLRALQRAGLAEEARPGAVAELWRAMRTDVAPTASVGF
ncbi:MAG: GNAT family N-acetyltransferase, partial [Nocardioidaceae bacterium]|nr:GNAT family N-acetyltransferase [Nocardioidaceae bacterium]